MRAGVAVLAATLATSAAADEVAPADLATTSWRVVSIGGEPIAGGSTPTLAFAADGAVFGDTGCNRFRAERADYGLFERLTATKRFCGDMAARDQRLLGALAGARALQRPDADRLLISGPTPLELRRQ